MVLLRLLFYDKVVSATSATMILFTSVTAATSFILFGLLPFDYGVVLLVCGFISTFAGQVVVMCYYDAVCGGGSCTSTAAAALTCAPPYTPPPYVLLLYQVVVHYLVQKFNRPSLIILSIGLAVAVSCAMMGGKGLHNYATRGPAAHTHVASIC